MNTHFMKMCESENKCIVHSRHCYNAREVGMPHASIRIRPVSLFLFDCCLAQPASHYFDDIIIKLVQI